MSSLPSPEHDPETLQETEDPTARLARLAARCLQAPVALVARLEGAEPRLWRGHGLPGAPVGAPLPLAAGLCGRVVGGAEPLAVGSVRDDLALRRDLTGTGFEAVAFAGAPLPGPGGKSQGVLAVLDREPRHWKADELEALQDLAVAVAAQLERQRLDAETESLAAALWQSEARYRRLTETAMSAVFVIGADGRLTEVNSILAEILDRPVTELIGRPFTEFVAPEDLEVAAAAFQRRLDGDRQRWETELRIVRPSGERRLLAATSAPVEEDAAGGGVHGVIRDITEDRARETQFRRAERMASVAPLLSGVCHELNNPLTSIKSFAELMLLDDRPTEDREALEIVQREAHRAAKIVSDLRVVARQTQEAGTGRGLVPLDEVVDHVLELRKSSLDGHRITVHRDLAPDLPAAWAVRTHLEQIVLQLVTNAEHALAQVDGPREIRLRTHRSAVGVCLLLEDSGPGIPESDLDRIFDPFWTTKVTGEGTGLGLSLVQSIVADHGGRIQVDSKPGRGATFSVELPAAEQAPVGLGTTEGEGASSRPLRLLVVDDEAPIRYSLTRYMQRRGHQVVEATEGGEALRLLDEVDAGAGYDIILADLRMPGLGGGQLLDRLRARGDGMEQRLIFITGDADSPDAEQVLRTAGVPVVLKPFELAEIAQIIESQAGMSS